MSFNTIPHGSKSAPIHRGEKLLTPGYTTDVHLQIPATIEGPKRKERAQGRVWLTDERLIFIRGIDGDEARHERGDDAPPSFHSLIIPYGIILKNEFSLPLFSANHLTVLFGADKSSRLTNLPDPGIGAAFEAKLYVNDGLGHNLYKRIEKEGAHWEERRKERDQLPAYSVGGTTVAAGDDIPPPPPLQYN